MAVKPAVEEYISRLDFRATRKAGFYKGAGQDDARITLQMTVAAGRAAARIGLEPNPNRSVSMWRAHATILHMLKADAPGGAQAQFRSIS